MKFYKLFIAIAILVSPFCTAQAVSSNPPAPVYYYVFNASPETPATPYDGSTIGVQGSSLLTWNLIYDPNAGAAPTIVANPGNSSFNAGASMIGQAGPDYWLGSFEVDLAAPFGIDGLLPFGYFSGTSAGSGYYDGSMNFTFTDAPTAPSSGYWSPIAAPGVPDTGTTIQLFGVALAGLSACRRWIRTRA